MDTFIQLATPWMTIIAAAIISFALTVLAWHMYFAAIAGLKCLYSYFRRREIINKDSCEKFGDMLRRFANVSEEIVEAARVNVLNRDDSVQYATLKDIPENEKIHHRIVRVGGDHPVDYIYNAKAKEWNPLFGNITLGYGAPKLMLKDIKDLSIMTRIPGQRICVPEVYKMYEIASNGEAVLLPESDYLPQTDSNKEITSDGQSN